MRFLLICLLSVLSAYANSASDIEAVTKDGKDVVLKNDRTWVYKNEKVEELYEISEDKDYFFATNGMDEKVRVSFVSGKGVLPPSILKKAVTSADIRCRVSAKNEPSYVPRSVKVFAMEGKPTLAVEFLATNSYGALGKSNCYYVSDSNGELSSAI